ncbi:CHAD domain-containing protein [Mesorhizobium sp. LHD-90]|uniref:CHAD domain-containing protein n=1 Tax=Mesorhizobium sp. LHD-90 TaxID=3071414 RepID=UPI0027E197CC|nr:CHAD domain-containing protein [Mesorhizobium sp. LHD-90]MDQ6436235.1 CHAD domain-containing protein [Mesorhizobium sp. LHD-90]
MTSPIDPREPFPVEIRRIVSDETSKAVAALETARTDPRKGFHECRKAIKRLRAVWRLIRSGDEPYCRVQDARLRDTARLLAGPREASALVETAERLAKAARNKEEARAVAVLQARLEARRSASLETALGGRTVADATAALSRLDFTALRLPEAFEDAAEILRTGARKAMRRADLALKATRETGKAEAFHDLRKAVKALDMQTRLLKSVWPAMGKRDRKAMEAFGERLGELNDLNVMDDLLAAEGAELVGEEKTALLRDLIAAGARKLRRRCLRDAGKLLEQRPAPVARKIGNRYFRRAEKAFRHRDMAA